MIACTSPAGTCSDTPFRIGLDATVAWRFSIVSMLLLDHKFVRFLRYRRTVDFGTLVVRNDKAWVRGCAIFGRGSKEHVLALVDEWTRHPTLPSRLIPSNFCASTANSIGSCLSTSRAKPLTISATA